MIEQEFLHSLAKYSVDNEKHQALWNEVVENYNGSARHYHNLAHLDAVLSELKPHQKNFRNWDTIVFAIVYHDLVYNSLKTNNEERSAEVAGERLSDNSVPENEITFCKQLILATKKHERGDTEMNLFTDADLSILGADAQTYLEYSKQIRREYWIYPDIVYNPGRKKVLMNFLALNSIYKTTAMAEKYELSARANIQAELSRL